MKNNTQEEISFWELCRIRCSQIFLVFIMTVYVLYCKNGFVEYDTYKRNLYLFGAVIFVAVFVLVCALSIMNEGTGFLKKSVKKADFWLFGLLAIWVIGFLGSLDKSTCFWGDSYRGMGLLFCGLGVLTLLLVSKFVKWNIWLTRIFLLANMAVFSLQIMNFFKIDPFGWTNYGEIHYLMSTLGNTNQNAVYDALIMAVLIIMLLFTKSTNSTILCTIALGFTFAGGISTQSASFYFGVAGILLVYIGFVVARPEYLKKAWITAFSFFIATVVMLLGKNLIRPYGKWYDTLTLVVLNAKFIIVYIIFLLLSGIICFKCTEFMERNAKKIFVIYKIVVTTVLIIFVICLIVANFGNGTQILNGLVITDLWGSSRGGIWKSVLITFKNCSIFNKLFGYGLSGFSNAIYLYDADRVIALFGENLVLADGHNLFFDMLITSGSLGTICYFGFLFTLLAKSVKLLRTNEAAIFPITMIIAYLAVCFVNSNLIITSQIAYMMLAVFYNLIIRCEDGEEINLSFEIMK